jgi:hypothetical protein
MAKKKTTKKRTRRTASKSKDVCCGPSKFKNMKCTVKDQGCGGCGYFLAFIGAAVYYISTATGFWCGVWGVIKALLWPAFLIFELLKFLGQ